MSCEENRPRLDDFVDNELDPRDSEQVLRHLDGCSSCRAEMEALHELKARVDGLPASLEPPRDLWPDIEARLARSVTSDKARAVWPTWSRLLGAAAAAALCAAVITGYVLSRNDLRPTVAAVQPGDDVRSDLVAASGESDYQRAREQLLGALDERRGSISPHTMIVVTDSVRLLDNTITRISGALEEHPGDSRLNRLLASAYQQELSLLQRATQLPTEG